MTDNPYVYHIPVMTRGAGAAGVRDFFLNQASALVQLGLLDPTALPVAAAENVQRPGELAGR